MTFLSIFLLLTNSWLSPSFFTISTFNITFQNWNEFFSKDSIISSSAAELESLISDLLVEAVSMKYVIPPANDPFTEVTLPDLILAACSRYTKAILRESSLRKEYREFVKENKDFYPDNPGIHQDLKCIFEW